MIPTRFSALGGSLFDLSPPLFRLLVTRQFFILLVSKICLLGDPGKIDPAKYIFITLKTMDWNNIEIALRNENLACS